MKNKLSIIVMSLAASCSYAQTQLVTSFEFNTPGDVEGWSFAGGAGFTQAIAVGAGGEGVLTTSNITSNNPNLFYTPDIALPVGETWDSLVFRFRQLDADPQNGGLPTTFSNVGTNVFFQNTSANGSQAIATQTYSGLGPFSSDTYEMTLVSQADDWQEVTISLTNAPTVNSTAITELDLFLLGSSPNQNLEVDFVRFFATVPEPSAYALLVGLVCLAAVVTKRRK